MPQVAVGVHHFIKRRAFALGHLMLKARDLGFHFAYGGKDRQRFIAYALVAGKDGLLFEQANAQSAQQNHLAAIGFFAARQQAENSSLPYTIAAHQPDALAGIDLQRRAAQHLLRAVGFVNVFEAEQHERQWSVVSGQWSVING